MPWTGLAQCAVGKLTSSISAPKKSVALSKQTGRHLIAEPGCTRKFYYQGRPAEITVLTDADWAANAENRRSTDCAHVYHGHLLEASSNSQQLVALSLG